MCLPSETLREQLQDIRRRLWILNATLESLPAKIELAYRMRSVVAGNDGSERPRNTSASGNEQLTLKPKGTLGGWWVNWKLARLRSRADRAERRAVLAIHDASVSFGTALEAVVDAAIARMKADEGDLGRSDAGANRTAAESVGRSLE